MGDLAKTPPFFEAKVQSYWLGLSAIGFGYVEFPHNSDTIQA
jgi:hypothetical protein